MTAAAARTEGVPVIDAARLPSHAFGHQSVMWWGTVGVMAIEGMAFALTVMMYFYIWTRLSVWPPDVPSPGLRWGTLNVAILLASVVPNMLAKRASEKYDLRGVRIWMIVCLAFGILFIAVRALEFGALNVSWDSNAYGSVVWLLLGLHTTHLVTDVLDTAVLAVLMLTGPLESARFVDVSENALYWNFVVAAWLPLYAVLYLAPRLL